MSKISETSKSRFVAYLKSKEMAKGLCERMCGWSSGYLSQKGELGAEKLADIIERFPEIDIKWLIAGIDPGTAQNGGEIASVSYTRGVPYYDVDFVCGFDMVENNQSINPDYLINFKKYDTADCWCNATGESMYPLIMSGDIIALKELKDWRRYIPLGEIYGVVTTEHRTIKKIGKSEKEGCIRLIPTNPSPEYAPQDVPIDIILRVYRVMGTMKRL